MDYKFYPKPFDVNSPPPGPPNRDGRIWPFAGWVETKDSKKRTAEYRQRLNEYGQNLEKGHLK